MKIGLISDIHGNGVALDACLDDLKLHEVDETICLGDALQGGCQPVHVMNRLQELGLRIVQGNADQFLLDANVEKAPASALEVRDWTREQLADRGSKFIESFQPTIEVELDGGQTLLCYHGSPQSYDDVILPETSQEELAQLLKEHDANAYAGGHTHLQWFRRTPKAIVLNPGSVGVSYSRYLNPETFYIYPVAEYAILHQAGDDLGVEFCRVPFSVDKLEAAAKTSGRPHSEREGSQYRPKN